jgi:hypothetical protein
VPTRNPQPVVAFLILLASYFALASLIAHADSQFPTGAIAHCSFLIAHSSTSHIAGTTNNRYCLAGRRALNPPAGLIFYYILL